MSLTSHEKARIALREWMVGRRFYLAATAMANAEPYHPGFRKDGVTPEFSHQIAIANHLRTLGLSDEDMQVVLIATFWHDTPEDKDLPIKVIANDYGERPARMVHLMTKEFRGVVVPPDTYFAELATDPLAAICKGGDRNHNLSTMTGTFTRAKQVA
jgi:(p)ppGpp synthase/HD superfamily hydrolase